MTNALFLFKILETPAQEGDAKVGEKEGTQHGKQGRGPREEGHLFAGHTLVDKCGGLLRE